MLRSACSAKFRKHEIQTPPNETIPQAKLSLTSLNASWNFFFTELQLITLWIPQQSTVSDCRINAAECSIVNTQAWTLSIVAFSAIQNRGSNSNQHLTIIQRHSTSSNNSYLSDPGPAPLFRIIESLWFEKTSKIMSNHQPITSKTTHRITVLLRLEKNPQRS